MGSRRSGKTRSGGRLARAVRSLLVSSSEMALAVVVVLLFGLTFTGILVLSFPKGTGLVSFYDELVEPRGRRSKLQVGGAGDETNFVAVVERVQRRVRDRPADALTWRDAHEGMRLEEYHTIQTLGRSAVSIAFGDRARLELGERSLVVVKQPEAGDGRRRGNPSVVLLGGRVAGKMEPGKKRSPGLDIVTSGGTSAIAPLGDSGTEFSVTAHDDESATVSVYSGAAEIETAAGHQRLGANEAITYDTQGMFGKAVRIPDAPRPTFPPPGHVTTYGAITPTVEIRWRGQTDADAYRLVVARDRDLEEVVYSGTLPGTEFVHGNLEAGRYYWSVTALMGRTESRPTAARSFLLRQDLEPPRLIVELPGEAVASDELAIRGETEPGCELYVMNESVSPDARGRFEHRLRLERGVNMIVIEAIDEAGNSTYHSQYVTARY